MLGKIKLRFAVIAIAAIIVTFFMQDTYAYYVTVGKATNVITSGDIQLVIHEKTDQGTEFPTEGVYIMPGDVVSKQVSVENACEHPFYLRVKIVYGIDSQELPATDCFKLNINEEDWTLHEGWYYYNEAVFPHEFTSNVFSHVEIVGAKVDNRYIGKTLTLTVDAQAVLSEHNPIDTGKTYTASGWPASN